MLCHVRFCSRGDSAGFDVQRPLLHRDDYALEWEREAPFIWKQQSLITLNNRHPLHTVHGWPWMTMALSYVGNAAFITSRMNGSQVYTSRPTPPLSDYGLRLTFDLGSPLTTSPGPADAPAVELMDAVPLRTNHVSADQSFIRLRILRAVHGMEQPLAVYEAITIDRLFT